MKYLYLDYNGEKFFTVALLPRLDEKFPTVIFRTPYVTSDTGKTEENWLIECKTAFEPWLRRGYAVVYQHCRGRGKSSGAFVPYINEREDGLCLRSWIREQSFYNGEIFLVGASYTASLHYATAPFEEDVKGAVFEVQDSERYRLWYRNGQMRKGHANWHFDLYKGKCGLNKTHTMASFLQLPIRGLSERVLGDRAEDFEKMLFASLPTDEFWNTRLGGCDAKNAVTHARIPILFTTGYNDFYIGGMFTMWNELDEQTKKQSAMLVSPYNHGDGYNLEKGLAFPNGKRKEKFGQEYQIDWLDNVRFAKELPYEKGVITYYKTFENTWQSDFYGTSTKEVELVLGSDEKTFRYDPSCPPAFCAEGTVEDSCDTSEKGIRVFTKPFEKDTFIKGKIRAVLTVESDCPDTSFYMQVLLDKSGKSYILRHDITSLLYQQGEYQAGNTVQLEFSFDEHAFLIKKGERLQVVISSTDDNVYVSHTNKKGDYATQTAVSVATNKVYLNESRLILPVEK